MLAPSSQNFSSDPQDGFPLSYYPMFTKKRGRTTKIHHLLAFDADGGTISVPGRCFGPGGMNTIRRQIRRKIQEGRAQDILDAVVERLPSCPLPPRWARLAVVTSTYRLDEASQPDRALRSRTVLTERRREDLR